MEAAWGWREEELKFPFRPQKFLVTTELPLSFRPWSTVTNWVAHPVFIASMYDAPGGSLC